MSSKLCLTCRALSPLPAFLETQREGGSLMFVFLAWIMKEGRGS